MTQVFQELNKHLNSILNLLPNKGELAMLTPSKPQMSGSEIKSFLQALLLRVKANTKTANVLSLLAGFVLSIGVYKTIDIYLTRRKYRHIPGPPTKGYSFFVSLLIGAYRFL